eukprot:15325366-Ditylum_brightwellii.AAC.1
MRRDSLIGRIYKLLHNFDWIKRSTSHTVNILVVSCLQHDFRKKIALEQKRREENEGSVCGCYATTSSMLMIAVAKQQHDVQICGVCHFHQKCILQEILPSKIILPKKMYRHTIEGATDTLLSLQSASTTSHSTSGQRHIRYFYCLYSVSLVRQHYKCIKAWYCITNV